MVDIRRKLLPSAEDLALLNKHFWQYASQKMPGLADESEDKTFLFSAYSGDNFIAGISGNVYWNGLEIDTLWVSDIHRGQGIGRRLVEQAEVYALENQAVIAFLKTVDAKPFYERLGYQVYGVLEDRPIGTTLYHMKKRLLS